MNHQILICSVWIACALGAGTVQAQKLTPGLWEHQSTVKSGSGQMEAGMAEMKAELARMPPEQRKQMEQAMAAQGVSMGAGPGAGTSMRICLSPEQAARDEMPMSDDKCKTTRQSRSGNTFKFAMECAGPPKSSGEGEFTMVNPKETTGKMKFVTATRSGPPETMEMQQRGRWISADCGLLKPLR